MKQNKIILIGAINRGKKPNCGETMKNQLFLRRFNELFDKVVSVDTKNWKKRPWCLLELFFKLLFNKGAKVIISASGAANYLLTFLYYIPLKKNVYFWVVGGDLPETIKIKGRYNLKAIKKVNRIIVQGQSMVIKLNQLGFSNVICVPNSKPILLHPIIEHHQPNSIYKFVFLSRIHPDKGIKEILDATKLLNEEGFKNIYSVDLYGDIDESYELEFNSIISNNDYLHYCGYLDLTNKLGYEKLSQYDAMLFPTYWKGEGFPGIVLDANIAGLPVIASDWNMNSEVIKEGINGFIIPVHNSEYLAHIMMKIMKGEIDLFSVRKSSCQYVSQFDVKNVLTTELMQKLGLYD